MNLRKIAIVGCGMVGSSTAFSLMESGLFTDILKKKKNTDRAAGEAADLSHCLPFTRPVDIRAADYGDIQDCGIIVITAGVAQAEGETRLDCIHRNVEVFRSIVPKIVTYNRDAFILVVTNPVDVMTFVTLEMSGLPASRVFGSGTVLDSARLKLLVGQRLKVDPRSVHAFVIGEHGDSELAVWSSANISGIALDEYCNRCGYKSHAENRKLLENDVKNSAYEIIRKKGATYYGIAAATRRICESIVRDEHSIMPLSTLVNGHYGLDDVCISLPALVGAHGVEDIIDIPLSPEENAALCRSADTLKSAISTIKI